jgi:hypothetical protein
MEMDFTKADLTEDQIANIKKIGAKAEEYGIDPDLALAVAWRENRFTMGADSPKGAIGIMQIMPGNAKGLGVKVQDLRNPDINIDAGMKILRENLDMFDGNERAALVAYNASPNTAKRYMKNKENPDTIPEETRIYLEDIHSVRPLIADAEEEEMEGPSFERPSASPVEKPSFASAEEEAAWISEHPGLAGAGAGAASGIGEKLYKYGQESVSKARPDIIPDEAVKEAMKDAQKLSGPDRWAKVQGGPGGETMQQAVKNYHLNKGLEGGETLTKSGIILPAGEQEKLDAELAKKQAELEERLTTKRAKASKYLKEKVPFYEKGVAAGKVMSKGAAKILSKLAPVSTTATGLIGGSQLSESAERFKRGDIKGGLLSGVTGATNLVATQPFFPVARGAAGLASIPLDIADYMYDPEQYSVVKESLKKKKD